MTKPTIDVQLLLHASRIEMSESHVAAVHRLMSSETRIDWGYVLDQASRHRVLPLMAHNLKLNELFFTEAGSRVPHSDLFRAALHFHRHRHELLRPAYAEALSALAAAGVDVMVRKGGYLAEHVYPQPATRPMKDLDLMIHKEQAQEAVAVLTDLGYRAGRLRDDSGRIVPESRREKMFWRMHVNNLPMMFRPTGDDLVPAAAVDFCLGLFLPGSRFQVDSAELFHRSMPVQLAGVDTFTLDAPDFVLDVAAHLYKESTTLRYIHRRKHQRLLQYWDLLGAIRHFGNMFDWDRLLGRVYDEDVAPPVYFALAHAAELAPGEVPEEVLATLRGFDTGVAEATDQYGEVDLGTPATWAIPFMTRMFDAQHPTEVPVSRSMV